MQHIELYLISFRGNSVFIGEMRRHKLPDHMLHDLNNHIYDIRHSDDDMCFPLTIENKVIVNHWGVIISIKPLIADATDYVELTEDESSMFINAHNTNELIFSVPPEMYK